MITATIRRDGGGWDARFVNEAARQVHASILRGVRGARHVPAPRSGPDVHLDEPELTVTTDYVTARALFVSQDLAKLMESFMMGKILVTGDVTRLLAWAPPTEPDQVELANEIAARLEAITAS